MVAPPLYTPAAPVASYAPDDEEERRRMLGFGGAGGYDPGASTGGVPPQPPGVGGAPPGFVPPADVTVPAEPVVPQPQPGAAAPQAPAAPWMRIPSGGGGFARVGTGQYQPNARQIQRGPELAPVRRERDEAVTLDQMPAPALYRDFGIAALQRAGGITQDRSGKASVSVATLQGLVNRADLAELTAGARPDAAGNVLVDPEQLARAAGFRAHLAALSGQEVEGASGVYRYEETETGGRQLMRRWAEEVPEEQVRDEIQAQETELRSRLLTEKEQQELQQVEQRQELIARDAETTTELQRRAKEREAALAERAAVVDRAYQDFVSAPPPADRALPAWQGIAAVIVGSLGGALGDPEAGVRLINQKLDRELAAQRDAVDKKRANVDAASNLYAQARDRFADGDAAYAAARAQLREQAVKELELAAWKFQGNQRALERIHEMTAGLQRQQQDERLQWAEKYGDRIAESQAFDPVRTVPTGGGGGRKLAEQIAGDISGTPAEKAARMREYYETGGLTITGGGAGNDPALAKEAAGRAQSALESVRHERQLVQENAALAAKAAKDGLTDREYLAMQSNAAKLFVVPGPGGSSRYGKSDEDRAAFNREIAILPPKPTARGSIGNALNFGPSGNLDAVAQHWADLDVKLQQEENALRAQLGR